MVTSPDWTPWVTMRRDAARTIAGSPSVPTAKPAAPARATNDWRETEVPVNKGRFVMASPTRPAPTLQG